MKRAVVLVTLIALSQLAAATPVAAAGRPGLTLSPTQGPQASLVQYRGSDFCSSARCGPVTIAFGDQIVASGVEVRSGGSFNGTFEVPPVAAGRFVVTARQPDSGRTAVSQYFVGPNLPASPIPTTSSSRTPGASPSSRPADSATPTKTARSTPATGSPTSEPASAGPPTGAPAVTAPSLSEPVTTAPAVENPSAGGSTPAAAGGDGSTGGGLWLPVTAGLALLLLAGIPLSRRLRKRHSSADHSG